MNLMKTAAMVCVCVLFMQSSVLAADAQYYTGEKIKGYAKGNFVVLDGDDINFRQSAENGAVLKVLPHHSLLRVEKQDGDWLQAESDGVEGYIYAPFTGAGTKDELTPEDFALGYAALGQRFDEQQAGEKLGKIYKMIGDKKTKFASYTYKYAVIKTTKQQITSICIFDPQYITMRGVSVGDSAGRAVGQYGLPDAVAYKNGFTFYEYFLQDDKKQTLRFAIGVDKDSRVVEFILEKVAKK